MADSENYGNHTFLLHSIVNQSRINESINYAGLLDLMNKYQAPPIKKQINTELDFIDELDQFLEQLNKPLKKQFYEESMILFDEQEVHNLSFTESNVPKQDCWLDRLPQKHEFDDLKIEELEKILQL